MDFLILIESLGESGLRVAGPLEWVIFALGLKTQTKSAQISSERKKLDGPVLLIEIEYTSSPDIFFCLVSEAMLWRLLHSVGLPTFRFWLPIFRKLKKIHQHFNM